MRDYHLDEVSATDENQKLRFLLNVRNQIFEKLWHLDVIYKKLLFGVEPYFGKKLCTELILRQKKLEIFEAVWCFEILNISYCACHTVPIIRKLYNLHFSSTTCAGSFD